MNTSVLETAPPTVEKRSQIRTPPELFAVLAGSFLVLLIHGYHPYSVDASIYIAGIKKVIAPSLYAADGAFITEHTRLSIFSFALGKMVSLSHVPLEIFLLLTYLVLTAIVLLAVRELALRIFADASGHRARVASWGAMLLTVACFPMPVAATSLLLLDPYVTARSLSTPLTLLAILAAINKSWAWAAACCIVAALFHPLMGVHLVAFLVVLFLTSQRRWRLLAALCVAAFLLCGVLYFGTAGVPVSASYREAVTSRSYYFLSRWQWYEQFGLLAPLLLMAFAWKRSGTESIAGTLALTCLIVGSICCLCSLCFVHPAGPYLLMRLQFLRSFHTIYAIGVTLLGASLAVHLPRSTRIAQLGVLAIVAIGMYTSERQTYRPAPHIELPDVVYGGLPDMLSSKVECDPWHQAFLWIRNNTPPTAVFAIDPKFLDAQGESMPGFRALTERSILTDVKDEGLASLFPQLAPVWAHNRDRESGIDNMSDAERSTRMPPVGVNWILLSPQAKTALDCPFTDASVRVCDLGGGAHDGLSQPRAFVDER